MILEIGGGIIIFNLAGIWLIEQVMAFTDLLTILTDLQVMATGTDLSTTLRPDMTRGIGTIRRTARPMEDITTRGKDLFTELRKEPYKATATDLFTVHR